MEIKKRNSPFEALRIISMLLVIAYHWQLHGYNDQIMYSTLSVNQIISFVFGSWGTLGVNLFFLISFNFLLQKEKNNYSKAIKLTIKTSFYGTIVYLFAVIFVGVSFSVSVFIKSILGALIYQYWFIAVYIVIYLLFPIFNTVIKYLCTKPQYYIFVIAILVYLSYIIGLIYPGAIVGRLACAITIYFLLGYLENELGGYNIFGNAVALLC